MKLPRPRRAARPLPALALGALVLIQSATAIAGPGAHGPNGEHLDTPTVQGTASALPRVETSSEAFELVATLHATELSILIDRHATNEPVLGAELEVESAGVKAKAVFHADLGDYAIDKPELLALLRTPGEHALVFTVQAGKDSDLLDGILVTGKGGAAAAPDGHGHDHGDHGHGDHDHHHELERAAWIGGGIAALGLLGGIAWWRQRRSKASPMKGAL